MKNKKVLKIREMTIEEIALSIINCAVQPLNRKEYKIFNISRFSIFKRRRFSNTFQTMVLCLAKRFIPAVYPEHSSKILDLFNELWRRAYENHQDSKEETEKDLKKFNELIEMDKEQPFLKLSLHIAEMFEKGPRKFVYAAKLNKWIEDLYGGMIAMPHFRKIKEK
ncbi:MAG: hypothetical protein C0412_21465 [Flavobacterium sp.]|nr:hypothetical protein [Flavobacterium sp.]